MPTIDVQTVSMVSGAVLTVMIFSYLLGDNVLYRIAMHLFVGTIIGYSFGIVLREALGKMVLAQLRSNPMVVIPVVIGLALFFFKSVPRLAHIGNYPLALLIGVGVAVALSGALQGTLAPQVSATGAALRYDPAHPLGLLEGAFVVAGTVCTLMAFSFTFTAQKRRGLAGLWGDLVGLAAGIGRWFLVCAFGVAFAGALTASLSIFIGRIQYLVDVIKALGFL